MRCEQEKLLQLNKTEVWKEGRSKNHNNYVNSWEKFSMSYGEDSRSSAARKPSSCVSTFLCPLLLSSILHLLFPLYHLSTQHSVVLTLNSCFVVSIWGCACGDKSVKMDFAPRGTNVQEKEEEEKDLRLRLTFWLYIISTQIHLSWAILMI